MIILITKKYSEVKGIADWLTYFNKKWIILTEKSKFKLKKITNNDIYFSINNANLTLSEISCIFYWRGELNIGTISSDSFSSIITKNEIDFLKKYIDDAFSKKCFNHPGQSFNAINNKLTTLNTAKKHDILCPNYLVCNNKDELLGFVNNNTNGVIIKTMSEGILEKYNDKYIVSYAREIKKEDIDDFPDFFNYTFFQEKIVKDFEIRSFILKNRTYSCCIIDNKMTYLDYREARNNNESIRYLPCILPQELTRKLIALMNELNYNMASVDLIYGFGKYYLLEINPIGQYSFLIDILNIDLYNEIAKELIYESEKSA